MNNPLISVIVPVYNVEPFLSQCIISIINQSFLDWELLLVNDGSTDGSLGICSRFAQQDARIHVMTKNNTGVSDTRNVGIDNSKGNWLCFVDSDDSIDQDYLLELYNGIDSNGGVNQFAMCGYRSLNEKNEILKENAFDVKESIVRIENAICNAEKNNIINSPVCKLFNREVIIKNNIRFNSSLSYGEDHLFVLDYCACVQYSYLSDYVGYNYFHRNNDSLTSVTTNSQKFVVYVEALHKKYISVNEKLKDNDCKVVFSSSLFEHIVRALFYLFCDKDCLNKKESFHKMYVINKKCRNSQANSIFYKAIKLALFMPEKYSYYFVSAMCTLKHYLIRNEG